MIWICLWYSMSVYEVKTRSTVWYTISVDVSSKPVLTSTPAKGLHRLLHPAKSSKMHDLTRPMYTDAVNIPMIAHYRKKFRSQTSHSIDRWKRKGEKSGWLNPNGIPINPIISHEANDVRHVSPQSSHSQSSVSCPIVHRRAAAEETSIPHGGCQPQHISTAKAVPP
jgi:hypothetical protein